jgi:hypothetical protein
MAVKSGTFCLLKTIILFGALCVVEEGDGRTGNRSNIDHLLGSRELRHDVQSSSLEIVFLLGNRVIPSSVALVLV